ncbi:lysis inhibition regulator [Escherichia phage vB_EcoM_ESCO47]|nr:lysis inhibition regulator [Escherichia phage vB_EcoM_ESCO47]
MALRAMALLAMLGLFVATTPFVSTAYVDPHFDNYMESGIKNVYSLFEIHNVENSEKFYSYMAKSFKANPCQDAFECHEQGTRTARQFAEFMNIKLNDSF